MISHYNKVVGYNYVYFCLLLLEEAQALHMRQGWMKWVDMPSQSGHFAQHYIYLVMLEHSLIMYFLFDCDQQSYPAI